MRSRDWQRGSSVERCVWPCDNEKTHGAQCIVSRSSLTSSAMERKTLPCPCNNPGQHTTIIIIIKYFVKQLLHGKRTQTLHKSQLMKPEINAKWSHFTLKAIHKRVVIKSFLKFLQSISENVSTGNYSQPPSLHSKMHKKQSRHAATLCSQDDKSYYFHVTHTQQQTIIYFWTKYSFQCSWTASL